MKKHFYLLEKSVKKLNIQRIKAMIFLELLIILFNDLLKLLLYKNYQQMLTDKDQGEALLGKKVGT